MPSQLIAAPLDDALEEAVRLDLAQHPTWLKLLHFERGGEMSVVLTDSFFLDPNGRRDPDAELQATLTAYFEQPETCDGTQARCRFPARYYWLSHQLVLPGYELRNADCRKLENWALFDLTKSISLLLVSGYLGNPASTFGHALIKLNTDSADDRAGLFDLTLNFGALVPANENQLFYVVRGLTGRYVAGFSDKYFYTQDLVYSRTEFRDMWDYRLDLTEYQRTLMILHIWEIVGKKFRYYFLDKNCAYRLAELLELVLEEEILDGVGAWYIPVDLFHRIQEIDQSRKDDHRRGLVQSMRYIPSSRRGLYHDLGRLDDEEMKAFNLVLDEGFDSLESHLAGFDEERKILLLNGLLAYQQYRIIADRPDSNSEVYREKDKILLARLRLPARAASPASIPELDSPADGFRPMAVGVTAAYESGDHGYGRLSWSPFKKESVGRNSLEGNELVVLDVAAGFSDDSPSVFLDRLDLVRVLSLNTLQTRIKGERRLSWKLRIGVDRIRINSNNEYEGVFSFGAGRAWSPAQQLTAFALLNVEAHTRSPLARIFPEAGLIVALAEFRAKFGFGLGSTDYSGDFRERWSAQVMMRLNRRHSIQMEHRNDQSSITSVGLSRYF